MPCKFGRRRREISASDWSKGDRDGVDAAFAAAEHVVRVRLVNNRIVVNSMEPRGAMGDFDRGTGRYTLTAVNQIPHRIRRHLTESVLHIPESDLRIVTPRTWAVASA